MNSNSANANQPDNGSPTTKSSELHEDIVFRVTRDGITSPRLCSYDDFLYFMDACGLDLKKDEAQIAAIMAGFPFEIDGTTMRFDVVSNSDTTAGGAPLSGAENSENPANTYDTDV